MARSPASRNCRRKRDARPDQASGGRYRGRQEAGMEQEGSAAGSDCRAAGFRGGVTRGPGGASDFRWVSPMRSAAIISSGSPRPSARRPAQQADRHYARMARRGQAAELEIRAAALADDSPNRSSAHCRASRRASSPASAGGSHLRARRGGVPILSAPSWPQRLPPSTETCIAVAAGVPECDGRGNRAGYREAWCWRAGRFHSTIRITRSPRLKLCGGLDPAFDRPSPVWPSRSTNTALCSDTATFCAHQRRSDRAGEQRRKHQFPASDCPQSDRRSLAAKPPRYG